MTCGPPGRDGALTEVLRQPAVVASEVRVSVSEGGASQGSDDAIGRSRRDEDDKREINQSLLCVYTLSLMVIVSTATSLMIEQVIHESLLRHYEYYNSSGWRKMFYNEHI